MANVTISKLDKVYPASGKNPPFHAVKGIDLAIEDREFMVLVGPSGCGKSTTLRMIAGLEEITDGTISIDSKIVNETLPKDRDIAMVFQNYALYPHMSVYDNMAFGLKMRRYNKAEIDKRVREAAAMLGLDDYLDRRPKALSGGQRQRVAVGRAIVRKPKVFLFDEPLSNLDAKMRVSTRAEISKLHARLAATMIYVTHDQVEAMTMGDRICVMNGGHIMQVDRPLKVYETPDNLFVAGFIGSPPMNLIHGSASMDGGRAIFREKADGRDGLRFPLGGRLAKIAEANAGKPLVFGIRPENVHDAITASAHFDHSHAVTVAVENSEPMGSETYLYLNTGAHNVIARIPPTGAYEPGSTATVAFDFDKAHLFDAQSELRIS